MLTPIPRQPTTTIEMAPPGTALADSPSSSPKSPATSPHHDLPGRTMTEEVHIDRDDAATIAAGEELKQTTISDKTLPSEGENEHGAPAEIPVEDKMMEEPTKGSTPEPPITDDQDDVMRDRITSPKKKRGRDFDEDAKDVDSPGKPALSADGHASRTIRSGPEKKRPRDASVDSPKIGTAKSAQSKDPINGSPSNSSDSESKRSRTSSPKPVFGTTLGTNKPQTSSSAFASSGFASLGQSSSSPFGTIGTSKPSVFGGGTSGFGALASTNSSSATTTTTTEAKPSSAFAFGGSSTISGFGGLKTGSVFGSALGNGFAGGAGPKLANFAAPNKEDTASSSKPAKAFGAPESDEEQDSEDDDSDGNADSDEEAGRISPEEKKKIKPVKIEDGEAGEATLLQIRARLYAIESKDAGWKERGVGTLKVNVPKSCASYDPLGTPIPGSFDISGLEDEDDENAPRVPRLVMRQENTHRVILNTIILREMEFKDKPAANGAQFMFIGLDNENKPVNMLLKMSENNAKLFRAEIDSVQREL